MVLRTLLRHRAEVIVLVLVVIVDVAVVGVHAGLGGKILGWRGGGGGVGVGGNGNLSGGPCAGERGLPGEGRLTG